MLRAMMFIDHMNFEIALRDLYSLGGQPSPKLDYNKFPQRIASLAPNALLLKTLLFIPKPDEFLIQDDFLSGYYRWAKRLNVQHYFDVVEGEYISRPTNPSRAMDIRDKTTYYKVEKGTDVNLAVEALSKGYANAYDIAIFLSADTDYIPVYKLLKSIGKLVVVCAVKGQTLRRIIPVVDNHLFIGQDLFDECTRENNSALKT